jgi:hypothetical protein
MLVGVFVVLSIVTVPLFGGSLRALGELALRAAWLLPMALACQVLVISVMPDGPPLLLAAIHGLSYLLAGRFVWLNRAVPGLPVIAVGGLSNAVTIAVNGGTLPASRAALRRAGLPLTEEDFSNSAIVAHARLPWLGDVFAVPAGVPFANVFSIGDIVMALGAAYAVHRICDTRLVRARAGIDAVPVAERDVIGSASGDAGT